MPYAVFIASTVSFESHYYEFLRKVRSKLNHVNKIDFFSEFIKNSNLKVY